jgi:hypothetical protein
MVPAAGTAEQQAEEPHSAAVRKELQYPVAIGTLAEQQLDSEH